VGGGGRVDAARRPQIAKGWITAQVISKGSRKEKQVSGTLKKYALPAGLTATTPVGWRPPDRLAQVVTRLVEGSGSEEDEQLVAAGPLEQEEYNRLLLGSLSCPLLRVLFCQRPDLDADAVATLYRAALQDGDGDSRRLLVQHQAIGAELLREAEADPDAAVVAALVRSGRLAGAGFYRLAGARLEAEVQWAIIQSADVPGDLLELYRHHDDMALRRLAVEAQLALEAAAARKPKQPAASRSASGPTRRQPPKAPDWVGFTQKAFASYKDYVAPAGQQAAQQELKQLLTGGECQVSGRQLVEDYVGLGQGRWVTVGRHHFLILQGEGIEQYVPVSREMQSYHDHLTYRWEKVMSDYRQRQQHYERKVAVKVEGKQR